MHEFHPYNSELPQIITSFKGNQKLILGGFRYNIHHVKEGVKTWRCVCAKKLTGTRTWCKGRAETWDSDSKGIPKGEHNHSTEHELAELEFFKSQMILAAISEPTADLSALMDEAAKFLSEGLNFGNRETMKKSLLVARKSVESGEFALGKHRTVSVGQQRTLSSSVGKKKGGGGGGTVTAPNSRTTSTPLDAMSAPTQKGTVHNKSQNSGSPPPRLSAAAAVALAMPSSSSKFASSPLKRSAVSDVGSSFDTSAASCSNTSGYGTTSSSGIADEDAAHGGAGIGWMDLSGGSSAVNFVLPEQLNPANLAALNGGTANMFGANGQPSSSADQQQLLAAALFAAAMLGNPSATPATTIAATLSTTLSSSTSTIGDVQHLQQQQQQTVGDMMMSIMATTNNNKATRRVSARSSATTAATTVGPTAAGIGAVHLAQQGPSSAIGAAVAQPGNSQNVVLNARKKTARVNGILNKLSTKAAEKSVSPSPSSTNSEPYSTAKLMESIDQNHSIMPTVQHEKHLVTVATQTGPVVADTIANGGDEQNVTRKRKSDENAPFGREQQQNANNEGTEKRKVICCCCCEESELNGWEMPLGCKRRVLKTEQNGTTKTMPLMEQEDMAEQENESDEDLFGMERELKLEIAEEDEEQSQEGREGDKGLV
uniref:FLYWCH-type domain-containing protein n=1 Tax=Globodera pallida TaxID=36090 RepID=A0A183BNW2_GLOPA